jgi:hypothetical protein
MKPNRILTALGLVFSLALPARAALLVEEPLAYPVGSNLVGQLAPNGNVWSNQAANPLDAVIVSGSLSYSGLAASSGNALALGGIGDDPILMFAGRTNGTIYYSFLLQITNLGSLTAADSSAKRIAGFTRTDGISTTFDNTYARLGSTTSNFNLGLGFGTSANGGWGGDLALHTTHLVVGSYTIKSGAANDEVRLWINPSSLGGAEPAHTLQFTNYSGAGPSDVGINTGQGIGRFYLFQPTTVADAPGGWIFDELRVGTTWADVTPTAVVPEPSAGLLLLLSGALVAARFRRA